MGRFSIGAALFLSLAATAYGQMVLHVDSRADQTPHDGSDWAHAFVTLQEALDAVEGSTVIRIAGGVYLPTQRSVSDVARTETFQLVSGVTLEGGYAGCGAPNPNARDVKLYETILSGDIGVAGDADDNARTVVFCEGVDATGVLDGLTIAAGRADRCFLRDPDVISEVSVVKQASRGGGVYIAGGGPTFIRCTFRDNVAILGGAVHSEGGAPLFTDCLFVGNQCSGCRGAYGGAVSSIDSRAVFADCVFDVNRAQYGGAVFVLRSETTFAGCTFSANVAYAGGGVNARDGGVVTLTNCSFLGNQAEVNDGGGGACYDVDLTLSNCAFSGNTADVSGGGVFIRGCVATLTNCAFSGNNANVSGGVFIHGCVAALTNCAFGGNTAMSSNAGALAVSEGAVEVVSCVLWDGVSTEAPLIDDYDNVVVVSYSCVQGGREGEGNIDVDPLFVDADGPDDVFGTADDDLRLQAGSPCIDAGDNHSVTPLGLADLDGQYRFFDDAATVDTGLGVAPIVDMGAYEFGSIAPPAWGDLNCDGVVDAFDVDPFVAALVNAAAYAAAYPQCNVGLADCSRDGLVNAFDIDSFVTAIAGVE